MENHNLIETIKNTLFTKTNKINAAIIRPDRFNNTELYDKILKATTNIKSNNISEKIYCIINNITESPVCPICGKLLKFKTYQSGYSKSCMKMFCIRKIYTFASSSKTKKQASLDIKTNFFKNYKNYIVDDISLENVYNFIDKRLQETNFGIDHQYINLLILQKEYNILYKIIKLTDHLLPFNSIEDFKWGERFWIIKNDIKEIKSCIHCNNKTSFIGFKKGYQPFCSKKCFYKNELYNIENNIISQDFIILNKINSASIDLYKIQCKKCNTILEKDLSDGKSQNIYCKGCYGNHQISKEEKDLVKYLKGITNLEILENYKLENRELDIYIPERKLAIEYNGLYWHSYDDITEESIKKYNHLKKYTLCLKNNINLIQIFSNQWENIRTKNIWKSIINNKLNINITKIPARKCIIKEIDNTTKNVFLNTNHLQGEDRSSIKLGLYHDNELVSVMTFSKSRYNKKYEYEMVRFCNKLNTIVQGGASKLLNYFEKKYNPNSLITYANKCYSNGILYNKLNFSCIDETQPNYIYWNKSNKQFVTRIKAQKHKLQKLLKENYNDRLTEAQNMFNNKYRRIWDCGNYVFVKKYDKDNKIDVHNTK
jgi:hypothetical protein